MGSYSHCQIPQSGKNDMGFRIFTLVGEILQYNYFPVLGCPPSGCQILFYHDCTPPNISLQFILCRQGMLFGRFQLLFFFVIDDGCLAVSCEFSAFLRRGELTSWRRKWQPTPVFLPGESHGRRSLVGCSPCGHTESDTTEATQQQQQQSSHPSILHCRAL